MIWQNNFNALRRHFPQAAQRLAACQAAGNVSFAVAKTGVLVPQIEREGRLAPLYSLYAPDKEGRRNAEAFTGSSALFLGLGSACHILPFLKKSFLRRILIVEAWPEMAKAVLEHVDLRQLWQDKRVAFFCGQSQKEAAQFFNSAYIPLRHGDLQTFPLRALTDYNNRFYTDHLASARAILESKTNDLATQAFFGKLWFRNIVRNLRFATADAFRPLKNLQSACVGAAGPGLELSLELFKKEQAKGAAIIICDAALGSFLQAGIEPDYVVTMDAQHSNSAHFLAGLPRRTTLLADLASPPAVTRQYNARFYAGGHPLCRLTGASHLDTSGGNVGQSAFALAKALGAKRIKIAGFDFSFPMGKPYAKGASAYASLFSSCSRLKSAETASLSFLLKYNSIEYTSKDGKLAYRPPLFKFYADNFKAFCQRKTFDLWRNSPVVDSSRFLNSYFAQLKQLDASQAAQNFDALEPSIKNLWLTLFPAAAAFSKKGLFGDNALKASLDFALQTLEKERS